MLLTAIFHHGYMPVEKMSTTIIPLLKDKNNCRPTALCSVASKIIEHIILECSL